MHAQLLQLFKQIAPIDKIEEAKIVAAFKPYHLAKSSYFLKTGEVNKYIGFIRSGLVRYFVYKNETEATFEFTREGEFIADYQSFSQHQPSIQNIQAIEDCELLVINFEDVQDIFSHTPHGNLLGRVVIEHRFDVMVKQLLSIYMHKPEQRYFQFMASYADLAQRIPLYMIASYVGIQPESLSRMRRRLAKSSS